MFAVLACAAGWVHADSWPMFGGGPSRNMVNLRVKNLPTSWCMEKGKQRNVKWIADVGTRCYSSPTVAGGCVLIGTQLQVQQKRLAAMKCFAAADGRFLWQHLHEIPAEEVLREAASVGITATPTVDGGRVYYGTPACEMICLGLRDGKLRWRYDFRKELGVAPLFCGQSSPLIVGDRLFAITGNGSDELTGKPSNPKAPSFVALHKDTGKLLWQSSLPGNGIIEGQWSNPAYAEVNGKGQVIFPGGDGYLYGLEATDGRMIWKFDCNAANFKEPVDSAERQYMVATPAIHDGKAHIGMGKYPDHPQPAQAGSFWCIDVGKKGDVSPKNGNLNPKAAENKDSALIWHYGGKVVPRPVKARRALFGATISTAAVHDGIVYAAELNGYLQALDAATGERLWMDDLRSEVWGSPLWADGKIFLPSEDGDVAIYAHGKTMNKIGGVEGEDGRTSTPAAANGVFYYASQTRLFAIESPGQNR